MPPLSVNRWNTSTLDGWARRPKWCSFLLHFLPTVAIFISLISKALLFPPASLCLMSITNVHCEMERNFGNGELNPPAESGPPGLPPWSSSHHFPPFAISSQVTMLDEFVLAALKRFSPALEGRSFDAKCAVAIFTPPLRQRSPNLHWENPSFQEIKGSLQINILPLKSTGSRLHWSEAAIWSKWSFQPFLDWTIIWLFQI